MTGTDVLVFRRGGYRFAVGLSSVRRIMPTKAARPVPVAANGVEGMTENAGEVHTLVTTPLPPPIDEAGKWPRWILVKGSAAVGFAVDEVEGIRTATERGEDDLPESSTPEQTWASLITRPVNVEGQTAWVVDVEALIRAHTEAA